MLGPKEPNLYKDLSQGTVTKGIQIKIFSQKKNFEKNFFLKIWIWIQMVIQMCNPDPDSTDFQKNISKKFFFLNFYFSLCHYYENLTNLPLNKSEGPYTTKLVKLYITYFVIFKLLKLLKLFSLSGSFLFLKVEVTPNKSSSWILISCFVKLAQSEHSLQQTWPTWLKSVSKLPKQCNIFHFPVFQSLILGLKIYGIYCSKNLTCFCGRVVSKIHSSTLILTCLWTSKRVLTKSLYRHYS